MTLEGIFTKDPEFYWINGGARVDPQGISNTIQQSACNESNLRMCSIKEEKSAANTRVPGGILKPVPHFRSYIRITNTET